MIGALHFFAGMACGLLLCGVVRGLWDRWRERRDAWKPDGTAARAGRAWKDKER